jgi:hypothetical protein
LAGRIPFRIVAGTINIMDKPSSFTAKKGRTRRFFWGKDSFQDSGRNYQHYGQTFKFYREERKNAKDISRGRIRSGIGTCTFKVMDKPSDFTAKKGRARRIFQEEGFALG